MKEKNKQGDGGNGGGDSFFAGAQPGVVSVSSGPYCEDLPVGGMTVGAVRQKYRDQFDIGDQAQAILDGKPATDETIIQGQALMFVQHAGEKGVDVHLIGGKAAVKEAGGYSDKRIDIPDLVNRIAPVMSTGPVMLPNGVKAVLSQGPITVWVWEQAPKVVQLSWIAADSPSPYGGGTKYRKVRIALPYLIIMAVFTRDQNGMPKIAQTDECFFRNSPLKSLEDELCFPALLNCSKFPNQQNNIPLSWICTQHLRQNKKMKSGDINDRFLVNFEAVRYCLLETAFNLSSEHHEGNSWYGASKQVISQINPVEEWEKNTARDPLFVLDMPWIKTQHSVRDVVDRIFRRTSAVAGGVKTSDDVARIILS